MIMALIAAAIAFGFAVMLAKEFVARRRPYTALWALALLLYGVASLVVVIGAVGGWTKLEYEIYWALGAVLTVPLLAAGEVVLLFRDRVVLWVTVLLLVFTEETRPERPTPLDEVRAGLHIFEQSLFDVTATVYEHCLLALRRACTTGPHGLPLIGIGDWNDGMNRVGVEGRGESVWLGWFLTATLRAFASIAETRADADAAADLRAKADAYASAVHEHGWDGAWYRRAYFDDGTALGSSQNEECRIDSIAQSWSVISGAGDPERQRTAMRSLETHLVREDEGLILLLTPPFDKSPMDPGYIKGYLPGVRENGAQYTHAALWAVQATALLGDGDRALTLYQMINPLTRARDAAGVAKYKVEPYVVAGDVYSAEGQHGRGGWTWYTGSASWMYRVGLETILGFTKRGDTLRIEPRVPKHWTEYAIEYRHGASVYAIAVRHASDGPGAPRVTLDGRALEGAEIALVDDGHRHEVVVTYSLSASNQSVSALG